MKPKDVPGHMELAHLRILRKLVDGLKIKGPVVELGSWRGRSAASLALSARNTGRMMHCIDPWLPYPDKKFRPMEDIYQEFLRNMKAVGLKINKDFQCHRMPSTEAVPLILTAAMVFVDASHLYEDVRRDFDDWFPKVQSGGVFAAHDYGDPIRPGPTRAWEEVVRHDKRVKSIKRNSNLIWAFL
jgi:hypothetical protein